MNARNASSSRSNDITYEWAIVPTGAQPVAHRRGQVRGAGGTGDRRRPRRLHRRVGAVVAPRREVHQPLPRRLSSAGRQRDPRRLGRHHRLEVDLVQQQRLQQLRLHPPGGDPHQRLAGEHDRALWHRVDVAREPKPRQVLQKPSDRSRATERTPAPPRRTSSPAPSPAPGRARPPAATAAAEAGAGRTARTPPARSSRVRGSWTAIASSYWSVSSDVCAGVSKPGSFASGVGLRSGIAAGARKSAYARSALPIVARTNPQPFTPIAGSRVASVRPAGVQRARRAWQHQQRAAGHAGQLL